MTSSRPAPADAVMDYDEWLRDHPNETPKEAVARMRAARPEGLSARQLAAVAQLVVGAIERMNAEGAARPPARSTADHPR
jgi:hypothetical protein